MKTNLWPVIGVILCLLISGCRSLSIPDPAQNYSGNTRFTQLPDEQIVLRAAHRIASNQDLRDKVLEELNIPQPSFSNIDNIVFTSPGRNLDTDFLNEGVERSSTASRTATIKIWGVERNANRAEIEASIILPDSVRPVNNVTATIILRSNGEVEIENAHSGL